MRDDCFIRGEVPMTKSEVRAVSLSKLELHPGCVVYDVGAGTGSVAVEAALAVPDGTVYAFEQKEDACALIAANRDRFGVKNLKIVEGKAPECMEDAPAPDCVFVGGSGGALSGILRTVYRKNPAAQVVLNVIALESLAQVLNCLKELGREAEIVTVQVSRAKRRGGYQMMQALNPVTVVTILNEGEERHDG